MAQKLQLEIADAKLIEKLEAFARKKSGVTVSQAALQLLEAGLAHEAPPWNKASLVTEQQTLVRLEDEIARKQAERAHQESAGPRLLANAAGAIFFSVALLGWSPRLGMAAFFLAMSWVAMAWIIDEPAKERARLSEELLELDRVRLEQRSKIEHLRALAH